jgi:hypothetical protein
MPAASPESYSAGIATPLSARSSRVTGGHRARTAATIHLSTATPVAGMDGARSPHRGAELTGVAIEDQSRQELGLAVIAMRGEPLLRAVGRFVGGIQIKHQMGRRTIAPTLGA